MDQDRAYLGLRLISQPGMKLIKQSKILLDFSSNILKELFLAENQNFHNLSIQVLGIMTKQNLIVTNIRDKSTGLSFIKVASLVEKELDESWQMLSTFNVQNGSTVDAVVASNKIYMLLGTGKLICFVSSGGRAAIEGEINIGEKINVVPQSTQIHVLSIMGVLHLFIVDRQGSKIMCFSTSKDIEKGGFEIDFSGLGIKNDLELSIGYLKENKKLGLFSGNRLYLVDYS